MTDVVFDINFTFLEKVWCETRSKEYTPLSLALSCGFQHRTRGKELKDILSDTVSGIFVNIKLKCFLPLMLKLN